ncbi:hypothetical protein [Streptomyces daliensis]|uniref:Uncharacterized protein n=1 Tax=Streptomyces daliensis TaxID=299421 RepID=A0A8T4IVF1_9ACTN|nr:hypothetical protein [Streptomyces daliensis]
MGTREKRDLASARDEADSATEELREALAGHAITLPSLQTDPVTYAGDHRHPLVSLGRCNVETARKLAAVLRTAWSEGGAR